MPTLYTYVVRIDLGFAPNPYHGFLTLACCKPGIRTHASIGDWVVGIRSKSKGPDRCATFAMRVSETLSREEYWDDSRFESKKPLMDAGPVEAVGDNAYHTDHETGEWVQEPCQHTESDCTPCERDTNDDLSVDRVLVGMRFVYWGGDGPELPTFAGEELFDGRNYKCKYSPRVVAEFIEWYDQIGLQGVVGDPADLKRVQYPGSRLR